MTPKILYMDLQFPELEALEYMGKKLLELPN